MQADRLADRSRRRAATRRSSARSGRTPRTASRRARSRSTTSPTPPRTTRARSAAAGTRAGRAAARRSSRRRAAPPSCARRRSTGCARSATGGRACSTTPWSAPRNTTSRRTRLVLRPGRAPRPAGRRSTPRCSPLRAATARPRPADRTSTRPLPAHSSVATSVCDRIFCRSRRLSRSGRSTRPPTASRQSVAVERRRVEVVADVEAGVRHHDAADQRRDRRLAVERVAGGGPRDPSSARGDGRQAGRRPRAHPAGEVHGVEPPRPQRRPSRPPSDPRSGTRRRSGGRGAARPGAGGPGPSASARPRARARPATRRARGRRAAARRRRPAPARHGRRPPASYRCSTVDAPVEVGSPAPSHALIPAEQIRDVGEAALDAARWPRSASGSRSRSTRRPERRSVEGGERVGEHGEGDLPRARQACRRGLAGAAHVDHLQVGLEPAQLGELLDRQPRARLDAAPAGRRTRRPGRRAARRRGRSRPGARRTLASTASAGIADEHDVAVGRQHVAAPLREPALQTDVHRAAQMSRRRSPPARARRAARRPRRAAGGRRRCRAAAARASSSSGRTSRLRCTSNAK